MGCCSSSDTIFTISPICIIRDAFYFLVRWIVVLLLILFLLTIISSTFPDEGLTLLRFVRNWTISEFIFALAAYSLVPILQASAHNCCGYFPWTIGSSFSSSCSFYLHFSMFFFQDHVV